MCIAVKGDGICRIFFKVMGFAVKGDEICRAIPFPQRCGAQR
uniref:Uncharacterized protein n=1 Tax=Klebsiella pneumoniae TaxID=573 RepID=A0A3G4RJA1_KLEPN|nr:hypothetical protein [Klebsiella pneumoniae]